MEKLSEKGVSNPDKCVIISFLSAVVSSLRSATRNYFNHILCLKQKGVSEFE